jgi:hypothetical protein
MAALPLSTVPLSAAAPTWVSKLKAATMKIAQQLERIPRRSCIYISNRFETQDRV